MAATPRIAILGIGPAGLNTTSLLHRNGISSTVFERDSRHTNLARVGTLDVHANSGQKSLRAAGLLEKFHSMIRPEWEFLRALKKDGTVLLNKNEEVHDSIGEQ
ncbi:hypothetical protein F5X99DRAFT_410942 [Biscogniauxia marginata]|nr:hypothetical protein F5X99DRAFT_410942 [Biscogniauxia marginata]